MLHPEPTYCVNYRPKDLTYPCPTIKEQFVIKNAVLEKYHSYYSRFITLSHVALRNFLQWHYNEWKIILL